MHAAKSGVADGAFDNDLEALAQVRRLIGFLPSSNRERSPVRESYDEAEREEPSLDTLVPANPNKPYDMKELILKVVDEADFFEISAEFARNIVCGFARMAQSTVAASARRPRRERDHREPQALEWRVAHQGAQAGALLAEPVLRGERDVLEEDLAVSWANWPIFLRGAPLVKPAARASNSSRDTPRAPA